MLALRAVDAILRRIRRGRLELVLPDGAWRRYGIEGEPPARLEVLDWAFLRRLARSPRPALGEGFQAREWQTPDLVGLLELFADNYAPIAGEGALGALAKVRGLVPSPAPPAWPACVAARRAGALRPVERVLRALARPVHDVLMRGLRDARAVTRGCATGQVPPALRPARARARAPSARDRHRLGRDGDPRAPASAAAASRRHISRAQHELASRRVREAGVSDRVEVLERDYRTLTGRYDRIVSIEMLEAIGHDQLPTYFGALDRLLAPSGVVAIQTITIPEQRYRSYRRRRTGCDGTSSRVACFPRSGDHARLRPHEPARGVRADEIGPHYVTTLARWRSRFLERLDEVRELGFDERFCRTWEFYLAYCEAAFASRAIRDVQLGARAAFERDAPTVDYGRSHPGGPRRGAR